MDEGRINRLLDRPLETGLARLKREPLSSELDGLKLRIDSSVDPAVAAPAVEQLLSRRHSEQNDFELTVPARLMEQHRKTQRIFTIVMSAVAGISLLVGGIGIMNIMLVSVTERTREIGLRLAVGASQGDILMQFLVEAVTLCLIGSFFGVAIGVGAGELIAALSDIPVRLNVPIIFIAISSAAFVGIFFGFYPARKASQLNPIDALRYE